MGITVDFSELYAFGAHLEDVSREALPLARAAIQKTAADIKREAQAFAPIDTGNLRSSITYETKSLASSVEAEIGPTASYGHYVEYGTSRMAPHAYLGPAFDRNVSQFEQALGQIADRI